MDGMLRARNVNIRRIMRRGGAGVSPSEISPSGANSSTNAPIGSTAARSGSSLNLRTRTPAECSRANVGEIPGAAAEDCPSRRRTTSSTNKGCKKFHPPSAAEESQEYDRPAPWGKGLFPPTTEESIWIATSWPAAAGNRRNLYTRPPSRAIRAAIAIGRGVPAKPDRAIPQLQQGSRLGRSHAVFLSASARLRGVNRPWGRVSIRIINSSE